MEQNRYLSFASEFLQEVYYNLNVFGKALLGFCGAVNSACVGIEKSLMYQYVLYSGNSDNVMPDGTR